MSQTGDRSATVEVAAGLAPEPAPPEGLRRRAARGTLINSAFMIGLTALQLLKNFLAAGLLATSAFGVWGILTLGIGILVMLKDGLGNKFVQQREADQVKAFQQAYTLELIVNALLMGLMLAVLPLVAWSLGEWQILAPGLLFIATLPALALKSPIWIFYRDMRYGRQRLLESIDPVVSLAATVGLAIAGFGYWALVGGYFAGIWAGAIVAVLASPIRLGIDFNRRTAREYFTFTWPIMVANGAGMLVPALLIIVGEATLGLAAAGMLTLAGAIASYTDRVDKIITDTMYPAICRVVDRKKVLFEAFIKSNRIDLMWGVPFGIAVALFASDLIEFGIGEKWRPGLILIQGFAIASALNHFGYNWTAFLRATGDTKAFAIAGPIVVGVFLVVTLPLLVVFGMPGVVAGMLVMTVASLLVRTHFIRGLFPQFSLWRQMVRGIAPSVPATALILLARSVESGDRTLGLAIAEAIGFVLLTALVTFLIERRLLSELRGYLKGRAPAWSPARDPQPT